MKNSDTIHRAIKKFSLYDARQFQLLWVSMWLMKINETNRLVGPIVQQPVLLYKFCKLTQTRLLQIFSVCLIQGIGLVTDIRQDNIYLFIHFQ